MATQTLWSRIWRGRESQDDVYETAVLSDILDRYDVVEVVPRGADHEPYMLVTDRVSGGPTTGVQFADPTGPIDVMTREMGSSSPSPFTGYLREDHNPLLRDMMGLRKYDEMRRSDGTVRGTLRMLKTPVLGARWFIEPASDSDQDKRIADFVWKCLTEYMSISFTQMITESLLMADFGYYMFEKVLASKMVQGSEKLVWQKLAPRHPMDVSRWIYDSNGGPAAAVMNGSNGVDEVVIPVSKLLIFTFDREAGDVRGLSVLRSAYKHWYYKDQLYKIDAIQKERHGIGIPVIKLPPGFSPADRLAADELGRNLRTNERAHVVLPPNWDLLFADLKGNPVDAMVSIEHHDKMIRANILAEYTQSSAGNAEIGKQTFLQSTRFVADIVCDTFNLYAIPQLVDFNYMRTPNGYPKLRARRIGESDDQRTLSFTIRNMVGAGVIKPDEELEKFVRRELDLPPIDFSTRVTPVQPQNPNALVPPGTPVPPAPPRVGPPRQSAPSAGAPRGNAGVDRSGGK